MKISGAARGCGWQKIGALVNLGAYYLIGIPIAITLAFVYHTGVKVTSYLSLSLPPFPFFGWSYFGSNPQGLLMGIIMALIMQALLLWIVTLCSDWEKEVIYFDIKIYLYHRPSTSSDGSLSLFCRWRKQLIGHILVLKMYYSKGEFGLAFLNWVFWKSRVFKKCDMKLGFFFKVECLVKTVKKWFLKKLSVYLTLIKMVVWVVNYQNEQCIYTGVYFILKSTT